MSTLSSSSSLTPSSVSSWFNYAFHGYWEQMGTPKTNKLFFMNHGIGQLLLLILCYLLFATKIGPQFMKNRKPFSCKTPMLIHNISLAIINLYFFYKSLIYLNFGLDLFNFKYPDPNDVSQLEMEKAWLAYLYFWTKLLDLMDTIFFVLRKKQSHITGKKSHGHFLA